MTRAHVAVYVVVGAELAVNNEAGQLQPDRSHVASTPGAIIVSITLTVGSDGHVDGGQLIPRDVFVV